MGAYAVVADAHGNARALEAVVREIDRAGVRDVVCLGDLVGYGAEPNDCVALARARGFACIAGNHELIALGRLDFSRCGLGPAHALARTRETLDDAARAHLGALPAFAARGDALFVHGAIDDVCEYMARPASIARNHRAMRARHPGARVCFFGHTHVARAYAVSDAGVVTRDARGALRLPRGADADGAWFVNPGAVDGARAPGKKARFAIVDDALPTVIFREVRYDHAAAERDARSEGYRLPRRALAWHAMATLAEGARAALARGAGS